MKVFDFLNGKLYIRIYIYFIDMNNITNIY